MKKINVNDLIKAGACDPYIELARKLAGDQGFDLEDVLTHGGLNYALWCLRLYPEYNRDWRLLAVSYARDVEHLIADNRIRNVLVAAERHANRQAADADAADAAVAAAKARADAAAVEVTKARNELEEAWSEAEVAAVWSKADAAWLAADAAAAMATRGAWSAADAAAVEVMAREKQAEKLLDVIKKIKKENEKKYKNPIYYTKGTRVICRGGVEYIVPVSGMYLFNNIKEVIKP